MDEEKPTPNPTPDAESAESTAPEPAGDFSLYRDPLDESATDLPKITVPKKSEPEEGEKEKEEDEEGASYDTIETITSARGPQKQKKSQKTCNNN